MTHKLSHTQRSALGFELVKPTLGDKHRAVLALLQTDDPAKAPTPLSANDITRRLHPSGAKVRSNWPARVTELERMGMLVEHHQGRDPVTDCVVSFYVPSGATEPKAYARNRSWKARALEAEEQQARALRMMRHLFRLCLAHGINPREGLQPRPPEGASERAVI